ncbi:MAG: hypothetical protein CSB34_04250 [Desulfobulbus propionicus]|nr:MAG: hypothetical protein CSB34_04250 [Desulfobulbus propionicus]
MVNSVNHNQLYSSIYSQQSSRLEGTLSRTSEGNNQSSTRDTVALKSTSTHAAIYSSNMSITGNSWKYGALQSLVADLLKQQGIDTKVQIGDTVVDIAGVTPEEAQELIADDGYFGVEKTSERIFQFAVGIAGGDPSRIDAIKEGIDKGFNTALEAFNGWLPDISYDTYDAVMEKLDNWVSEPESVV